MDLDSALDSILSTGWVGFQICESLKDLDSVLDSILPMGWVGFQICESLWILGHRLDRIMDLFSCFDLDSGLDSFFFLNSESVNPTTSSHR